ncbi:MAG: hypothetical protein KME35_14475 [Aphanocapsa sp. GSE-SYN-MK-11-07L]|jgi:hypothetical protein|nr:hypothetical protein [Aphanocapsa sp. GSE-SYN-MK-11-07L]
MNLLTFCLRSVLGLATVALPVPIVAQPAPFSSLTYVTWDQPGTDVDDCKSQGTSALAKAGMSDFSITESAVFATKAPYEGYVYCIFSEKNAKIGVVGVSGPDTKESGRLRKIIEDEMTK